MNCSHVDGTCACAVHPGSHGVDGRCHRTGPPLVLFRRRGTTHWGGTCHTGKAQSPIEIRTEEADAEKLPRSSSTIDRERFTSSTTATPSRSMSIKVARSPLADIVSTWCSSTLHKPSEESDRRASLRHGGAPRSPGCAGQSCSHCSAIKGWLTANPAHRHFVAVPSATRRSVRNHSRRCRSVQANCCRHNRAYFTYYGFADDASVHRRRALVRPQGARYRFALNADHDVLEALPLERSACSAAQQARSGREQLGGPIAHFVSAG